MFSCIVLLKLAFSFTVYVLGSYFRTLSVILVSDSFLKCNRVHCVCFQGHDPITFFFSSFFPVVLFLFKLGGSFMALMIGSVQTCALCPPRPLSPSVNAEAGYRLV